MTKKIKEAFNKCKTYWTNLDKVIKKRVVLLAILVGLSLSAAVAFLNTTEYETLYTIPDLKECGEITEVLSSMNVRYKINGNTVLVDKKQVDSVKMQLAMQGYPKTGLNYDLYNSSIGLTTSSEDKKVLLLYQLQERLSSVISTLSGIKKAIVTISMPKEDVFRFKNESVPVSACVVIEPERGFQLEANHVTAIKHLMVTSVAGLNEENLSIIDTNLNFLNPRSGSTLENTVGDRYSLIKNIENELGQKIQSMFEPVFGMNNIKTAIKVTMDFDKKSTEIIEYSTAGKDEGIPYMVDEFKEKISDSTLTTSQENENNTLNTESFTERVQNVVNYRVNELKQTVQQAEGRITDISVSILINKTDLDPSALEELKTIASAAVGVDSSKIALSVMNFTAREDLQDMIDKSLSNEPGKERLLTEKTLVACVFILSAFIFAVLVLLVLKPKKEQIPDTVSIENVISQAEIDENKKSVSEANEQSEKEINIIHELEKFVKTNPKDVASLLSYWIDNTD